MTDKQIIIDGVDVAKCRCFTSEWDFNNCGHICKGTECKYKRLWYKKQLKAKEQECEELKEDRERWKSNFNGKVSAIEELLKQLDQLKQTLAEIKEITECMHDLWINKTTYTDMDNLVKHLLECELNRIRYKLDEISECEVE